MPARERRAGRGAVARLEHAERGDRLRAHVGASGHGSGREAARNGVDEAAHLAWIAVSEERGRPRERRRELVVVAARETPGDAEDGELAPAGRGALERRVVERGLGVVHAPRCVHEAEDLRGRDARAVLGDEGARRRPRVRPREELSRASFTLAPGRSSEAAPARTARSARARWSSASFSCGTKIVGTPANISSPNVLYPAALTAASKASAHSAARPVIVVTRGKGRPR